MIYLHLINLLLASMWRSSPGFFYNRVVSCKAWVYEKTSQSLIAISIAVITSLAMGDIVILLALDFVGWAPTDCTIGGVVGVVGGGGVGSKTYKIM